MLTSYGLPTVSFQKPVFAIREGPCPGRDTFHAFIKAKAMPLNLITEIQYVTEEYMGYQ
jgi:hypothetical protein